MWSLITKFIQFLIFTNFYNIELDGHNCPDHYEYIPFYICILQYTLLDKFLDVEIYKLAHKMIHMVYILYLVPCKLFYLKNIQLVRCNCHCYPRHIHQCKRILQCRLKCNNLAVPHMKVRMLIHIHSRPCLVLDIH